MRSELGDEHERFGGEIVDCHCSDLASFLSLKVFFFAVLPRSILDECLFEDRLI